MWRGIREYALSVAALAVPAWPCMSADQFTGVSGMVRISPARPGPQHAGESDASPYPGVRVQLRDTQGNVVAQATTNAQGQFTVAAPLGVYRIQVDVQRAALPRCEAIEVTVRANQSAHVAISCDSGMR